jgi:4-carboxymuconolactone decarboxylase
VRLSPIEPGSRPDLADLEARIRAARGGRIPLLYQVLLNSPAIADGWEQMLSAVRNRNSLPADVRELVILRVAVLNRAPYEFDAHAPIAVAAGLPEPALAAVRQVPLAEGGDWTPLQRVALRLTDAMTRDIDVSDALYAEVAAQLPPQGQLDLVATIAAYNMVSRLLAALQVGH